ncbi:methyltransferase [Nocardia sp. NPDC055321]
MTTIDGIGVDSNRSELLRLLLGGWMSAGIGAAVELGIADALHPHPADPRTLAKAVGAEQEPLTRLLRLLRSLGLVDRDSTGAYALTSTGELLRADHPQSMHDLVRLYQEGYFADAWRSLVPGVRTGAQPFALAHGQSVFDYLAERADALATYSAGIAVGSEFVAALPEHIDFEGRCVLDVGGGDGTLLDAILTAVPTSTGILLERAAAVGPATERLRSHVTDGRCEVIAGDFFSALPDGADTIILCRVLHNWNDDEAARILRNCRAALRPGGQLLTIERVVSEHRPTPVTAVFDVHMFVMTSGRERTDVEYRKLLTDNDFELTEIRPLPLEMSVVQARVR